VADIPGLIEGSHNGKGLGIKFLKHIERTKVLAILVSAESEDLRADAQMLVHELSEYSPVLAEKPKCFILSKADLLSRDALKTGKPKGWLSMSSMTGAGVQDVLALFKKMLDAIEKP
jgi:GTP-binding protein